MPDAQLDSAPNAVSKTFEERKWEDEIGVRRAELEIKKRENNWLSKFTPLTTTLMAGVLTLAGSAVAAWIQGSNTLALGSGCGRKAPGDRLSME
jgi:hypothetical protein